MEIVKVITRIQYNGQDFDHENIYFIEGNKLPKITKEMKLADGEKIIKVEKSSKKEYEYFKRTLPKNKDSGWEDIPENKFQEYYHHTPHKEFELFIGKGIYQCCVCGCFKVDSHPERKTPKDQRTCSRTCYYQRLKEEGNWNRGKTWKEMYNPELLEKMQKRVNAKGKEHFNYNGQRIDTTIRNFINNPQTKNEKILEELPKAKLIKIILKEKTHKKYAYQRKAFEKYGRKCQVCGKTKGQIDIHHIDGNHNNNELSNLMVLCPKHHREIHKQKDSL